jgi:hypothetical protein
MSIYPRLYQTYKKILACRLLTTGECDAANLSEFETLLNEAQPQNEVEKHYYDFHRGIFYSNPVEWIKYVGKKTNRAVALILWTESKHIVRHFNIRGHAHVSWNAETQRYVVAPHITIAPTETLARPVYSQQPRKTVLVSDNAAHPSAIARAISANTKSYAQVLLSEPVVATAIITSETAAPTSWAEIE